MTNFQPVVIAKEEAKAIVEKVPYDIIHCFAGFIGADWNKEGVLAEIEGADIIAWSPNIFHHELATQTGERIRRFDLKRPVTEEVV